MAPSPNRRTLLKTAGSASALFVTGGIGTASARKGASAEKKLVKTTIDLDSSGPFAGSFDTLIAAVIEAELVDTLGGNRQLTVFGPTDDAFDEGLDIGPGDVGGVEDDLRRSILTYHVSPGRRYSESVTNASTIPTSNGARIDVEDELIGKITATDVEAPNGVIHAISTVLTP